MYKISYAFANNRNTAFINDGLELAIVHTFSSKNQSNNLNSTNEDLNIKSKEANPQNRLPATNENFYLLKLKLIVDRLDVLIKSKEISKNDIQSELNRIIVEIQELSKMTTNEKYLEVANQYKQLIADKLKLLESKIHQQ
jgi:response regulator RpfG family c-di-GMP phosphodiesterase